MVSFPEASARYLNSSNSSEIDQATRILSITTGSFVTVRLISKLSSKQTPVEETQILLMGQRQRLLMVELLNCES